MQQSDQTVLSLRPGGGKGSRPLGPRFDSSTSSSASPAFGSFSSDLPLLRPHGGAPSPFSIKAGDSRFEGRERVRYTREQLLQLSEGVEILDDVLKIKQDIEAELFGEDQSWARPESNPSNQFQNRYSEPDNRDWRGRSAGQPFGNADERSWDNLKENKEFGNNRQDQMNSQFARAQISSNQGGGPTPTLVKAEVPWSARKGTLSEKDRVLKTVKGILNKLTPEKFDLLKGQLIDSGITSADILKGVISLIFDKAVLEPTFCPMYAQLCSDLNEKLPPFPSDEPGGKEITFKRVLLNICHMAAVRKIIQVNKNKTFAPSLLAFRRGIAYKLFVGGLSFYTTEKALSDAFSNYGQVIEAKVVTDRVSDRSKGFGFVTFASPDEAENAITEMKGKTINGRVIFVDYAKPNINGNAAMPIARGPPEPTPDT